MTTHLEEVFPAYDAPALPDAITTGSQAGQDADPLFDVKEVEAAALRSALSAPIERWMTFLHSDQVAMTRRHCNGPARISGPAGTGKTVVGLHRAAYLAERSTGRILYVTFANNLPRVQGQLFRRLSPATAARVEFTSLHAWAQTFLAEHDVRLSVSRERAETAFSRAWSRAGRDSVLVDVDPSPAYWKEEIDYVIKGRGLTSLDQYRGISRYGRRSALRSAHREAAWLLYEEYELLRTMRGVHDFNDVLLMALDKLRDTPADPPYTSVIVDEVQDLTLIGVKLLHTLVGDAPNGLLLIGDGQQAVYPGGFRLSDAGIAIKGRGGVLHTNYRNATPIIDTALAVISNDPFEDLEESNPNGHRTMELTYHDGQVIKANADDEAQHDRLLVEALQDLAARSTDDPPAGRLCDAAVLCATRRQIAHYQRLLNHAGIPVLRLEQYDGQPVHAVKLGTYRRAKGLEFKYVYLPRHDMSTSSITGDKATDHERAVIIRRQLFVAMTRARDLLWLGSIAPHRK
ncbi:UvrD-helicase domain-containing protein [Streptosporangium soli]|nr:AAA family ATPase [Streptosporangium sp. KLBMP 9127]